MLDQEPDEAFVRAERSAMNAERCLVDIVAIFVAQVEAARLREIDLIGRDREFAADRAPGLDVNLWSVKRGFVRYFDIIDPGIFQHVARHYFGLFPKLRFIDKFLSKLVRFVG